MKKLMSSRRPRRPAGDTLIEVLFAFTILSAVISVAFGGALSSYKSAQTAQNRTQALFLAQYQADALKTYRDSLAWDNTESQSYCFLETTGTYCQLGTNLTAMKDYALSPFSPFCMVPAGGLTYWKVQDTTTTPNSCDERAKTLAPNLNNPTVQITLGAITNNSIKATVTVSYTAANKSTITEKVTNTILLTKQR